MFAYLDPSAASIIKRALDGHGDVDTFEVENRRVLSLRTNRQISDEACINTDTTKETHPEPRGQRDGDRLCAVACVEKA